MIIVDDGDWGFAPARLTGLVNAAGWSKVVGAGHNNDYALHANDVNESVNNFARWTMTTPSNINPIEIFSTWIALPGNAQNATYQIYNGSTLIGSVVVDQQSIPNPDVLVGATPFHKLGDFLISTGLLTVRLLTNGANGDIVADAVMIQ